MSGIDSIATGSTSSSILRSQNTPQVSGVRNVAVLDTIEQSQQKTGNATNLVKPFAATQAAGAQGVNSQLPRGSLVDMLV